VLPKLFGTVLIGAGEPLVGLGEAEACRAVSRTQLTASASFSTTFDVGGSAATACPTSLLNRAQASDGPDPKLARPRPIPGFFLGETGAGATIVVLEGGGCKPTAKLFLFA
jgi:hypothetical protein